VPGGGVAPDQMTSLDLRFEKLAAQTSSIVITAKTTELALDLRNAEVFNRTLFTRDSRVTPLAPMVGRIHGTPGYPLTAIAGLTFRLRGK
jgi:hypothetical protein